MLIRSIFLLSFGGFGVGGWWAGFWLAVLSVPSSVVLQNTSSPGTRIITMTKALYFRCLDEVEVSRSRLRSRTCIESERQLISS